MNTGLFQQALVKPEYALGFVVACPDRFREEAKTQKKQAFSEGSIVISMVSELNAAKPLIMSAAADGLVIEVLMHISGLNQPWIAKTLLP